jgi:hypothetical protein
MKFEADKRPVFGAYGYDVDTRCSGEEWSTFGVGENDWSWAGLVIPNGSVFEIRVRAQAGEAEKGEWTEIKIIHDGRVYCPEK